MADVRITKITDGLGFGEGTISFAKGKASVDAATLVRVEALITTPGILVPLDTDGAGKVVADDGCGDGRPVGKVMQGQNQLRYSLNRAKVFGGGAAMTVAALIGVGKAQGKTLAAVFDDALALLTQHGLDFGAHTDDHAVAPKGGCGAIDNALVIIQYAAQHKEAIKGAIEALGGDLEDIDEVLAAYETYAVEPDIAAGYSGETVVKKISERNKVVKQLRGDHHEMYIVLNAVRGSTLNQAAVRDISDDHVQVFGVDLWRMEDLAKQFESAGAERQAFLGELVYTLATAAVLTSGDLPVYAVRPVA